MPCRLIDTLASVFTAFGTVAVAILAIWGDRIRNYLFGPLLELSLVNPLGDLTRHSSTGSKIYYHHIRLSNPKGRIPARGVRVVVQGVSRRTPSGAFVQEPLVYPLQLVWTPMEQGEVERTVVDQSTCDFGFLGQSDDRFQLALWLRPNNFRGHVGKDECLRFEIVATGQNVFSLKPTVFEVSWDGQWTENQEEMKRHLVIRTVPSM
jgi:hypothetical protein